MTFSNNTNRPNAVKYLILNQESGKQPNAKIDTEQKQATLSTAFVAFINMDSISGEIERYEPLSYLRNFRWLAMILIVPALSRYRSPSSSQYKVQYIKAFHAFLCK